MSPVTLLLSSYATKLARINLVASERGLPAVLEPTSKVINTDYRIITHPQFWPPSLKFEVIYKVDSPEELNLGTF